MALSCRRRRSRKCCSTRETLVVTDGTTLLGADDKAGIAEIMAALESMIARPELPRGDVKVAFAPDEEIGHGASLLDLKTFGADFAYTVDGGAVGEISYETFNAAKAKIVIHGRSVHPGKSKDKMVNSILLGMELAAMFPANETPTPKSTRGSSTFSDSPETLRLRR